MGQRATGVSPVAQLVKNLPAMQETPVRSLVWEDPLEKGMATSITSSQNTLVFLSGEGAWWATVYGVTKSRTQLSNQHLHFMSESN